jgi:hypothetical protein
MDPLYGPPTVPDRPTQRQFPTVGLANVVTALGGLLAVGSLASAWLTMSNTSYFGYEGVPVGSSTPDIPFSDRAQVFLQNVTGNLAWSLLVVAAGLAVRALATRPAAVVLPPPPPMPALAESPVDLPERASVPLTQVTLVEPSADDSIWRR